MQRIHGYPVCQLRLDATKHKLMPDGTACGVASNLNSTTQRALIMDDYGNEYRYRGFWAEMMDVSCMDAYGNEFWVPVWDYVEGVR